MLVGTNVHLNPPGGDNDDLYSGFGTEEVAPALQTDDLEYDEGFQVQFIVFLFSMNRMVFQAN